MKKTHPGIFSSFIIFLLFSCLTPHFSGDEFLGPKDVDEKEQFDITKFINPDQPLAYIAEDDPFIYVAKGYEQEVAKELGAEVNGDTWKLQEEKFLKKRKLKELKWEDYHPRVAIIIWTYMKGFKCKEIPAGTWLNVTSKKNKFLRSYKTPQKDWWCLREKGQRCKIVIKKITGDFLYQTQRKREKESRNKALVILYALRILKV